MCVKYKMPSIASIVTLKRVVRRRATRKAAKNRTFVWNKIEREALGLSPKTNMMPPNFIGTVNQKYQRSLAYTNRLTKFAKTHKMTYKKPLYRAIYGTEFSKFISSSSVHKVNLSSFTKSRSHAIFFTKDTGAQKSNRAILVLSTSGVKIPAVNYTTGYFNTNLPEEEEVLLPPGTFYKYRTTYDKRSNMIFIYVNYVPD